MKNVIHIFGASGSGTTMARLCLSAFARVATLRPFSAAHGGTIFATAHSCGLRQNCWAVRERVHALPQRIRAGCDAGAERQLSRHVLCHSAFVRVATRADNPKILPILNFASAHSRGLRQGFFPRVQRAVPLCLSAFVRVATDTTAGSRTFGLFATAHSCGLRRAPPLPSVRAFLLCHSAFVRVATQRQFRRRLSFASLPQRIRAGCDCVRCFYCIKLKTLPQRIRAGCDCGKAMQRTANLLREGR